MATEECNTETRITRKTILRMDALEKDFESLKSKVMELTLRLLCVMDNPTAHPQCDQCAEPPTDESKLHDRLAAIIRDVNGLKHDVEDVTSRLTI